MRKIILMMSVFWPTADTDPSSTGPMVEFARIWRDMPKIVFSRTLKRADWNTTVVREVVIGQGKPLFQASDTKINLQLAETRTFGNGVVLLRYLRRDTQSTEMRDSQAL